MHYVFKLPPRSIIIQEITFNLVIDIFYRHILFLLSYCSESCNLQILLNYTITIVVYSLSEAGGQLITTPALLISNLCPPPSFHHADNFPCQQTRIGKEDNFPPVHDDLLIIPRLKLRRNLALVLKLTHSPSHPYFQKSLFSTSGAEKRIGKGLESKRIAN